MKTDPTKKHTKLIYNIITYHRIRDNYNPRSQNIILYIIYNIIRIILKSSNQRSRIYKS